MTTIGEPRWIAAGSDGKSSFERRVAFAQNNQSHVIRQQTIEERGENSKAFFGDHACDHSENRTARRGGELEIRKQGVATDHFAPQFVGIVMRRQQRVGCRLPTRVSGAMRSAAGLVPIFTENE